MSLVFFLFNCENKQPKETVHELNDQQKEASVHTKNFHQSIYESYPFEDTLSFEDAQRGFIAPLLNNGHIEKAEGGSIWDLGSFSSFINDSTKAPLTVNPSLWRQSQLLMSTGLFEVVPGIYQVRGLDLANMTIIEGDSGITVYDPLFSAETAKSAIDLYSLHRGKKRVMAVVYSHSHADHFGGMMGVVSEMDLKKGKVKIYAPAGFVESAISENVYAGNAMGRRASYMYGNLLDKDPKGLVGSGLGISLSSGYFTLIAPNEIISGTGEERVIDGIVHEFFLAPESEAPSEMMWYLPQFKVFNTAEEASQTLHNLVTLRGAKTRDASMWSSYLNEVIAIWGDKLEVAMSMHHWPVWGNKRAVRYLKTQRDIYKFIHDQTLHYANLGYTINEIVDQIELPEAFINEWGVHGYYGTISHNVRAVYNYYLGYFDGNPAHLDPLPPEQVGIKYVEAMGGSDNVLKIGEVAFRNGEYRWAAEVMNHLVFAEPDNRSAQLLQADVLEQMGYQAESGPWRNFYLSGAKELRDGPPKVKKTSNASLSIVENMHLDLIFGFMGVSVDPKEAMNQKIYVDFVFPDTDQKYSLYLENSVLNFLPNHTEPQADATVTIDRNVFNRLLMREVSAARLLISGDISIDGNPLKVSKLMGMIKDFNENFWFNIVEP